MLANLRGTSAVTEASSRCATVHSDREVVFVVAVPDLGRVSIGSCGSCKFGTRVHNWS